MEEYYTVQEIADILRVSRMTIYRYIKAGTLKAIKLEQKYRVSKSEFKKYLKSIEFKGDE